MAESNNNNLLSKEDSKDLRDYWDDIISDTLSSSSSGVTDGAFFKENAVDGSSISPTTPFSDILYLLRVYDEDALYIPLIEKIGRPIPNAVVLSAFEGEESVAKSASSDLFPDALLSSVEVKLNNYYDVYGSIFSQDFFDDMDSFDNIQPHILIPAYKKDSKALSTPVMGLNALSMVLDCIELIEKGDKNKPSMLFALPSELESSDDICFNYLYSGYASLNPESNHKEDMLLKDEVFIKPNEEGYDLYGSNLSAIHISLNLSCLLFSKSELLSPSLSEHPFAFLGHSAPPPMWMSLLTSEYMNNPVFKSATELAIKYQEIFAFLLAVSSGLPLSLFHSFKGRDSGFRNLSSEDKKKALIILSHLVDEISLRMQSNYYLQQTPLKNLYE